MSSTTNLVKYRQCVSEKSIPFKPIKRRKIACLLHPSRANCRLITSDRKDYGQDGLYHETTLNTIYINYNHKLYYSVLLKKYHEENGDNGDGDDGDVIRGHYNNADTLYAYVQTPLLDDEEQFYGIDENGERQMRVITNVIKSIFDAFRLSKNYVILCVDELQLDLLYSVFRTIILPQRLIAIHFSGERVPTIEHLSLVTVPKTDDSSTSQEVYRTFIVYNTVLSMILKQRNPFNEPTKSISIVFRNLGKCPNNKDRIKCCDLKYGGNVPGHVMCPPREMVRRIFHYAKWARTPNNYKRYFELIVKPRKASRKFIETQRLTDVENSCNNRLDINYILMDWYNFIYDFRVYFGLENEQ
ncbi:vp1054 [Hemileuca sp. nucleopolyhedrovirus]|uniref:Vp1054 n=1 Tax=Hemileuca sp. nucleopolyhedrovirus TaxID=1367203 RepID=S5MK16_9ABAC|nr:vp1054 [Hemileuca sp. nucleopolyhedrovirus]AGR56796.1 vp1054 [Hemileuca sp. nucleopolyhedrovirus]